MKYILISLLLLSCSAYAGIDLYSQANCSPCAEAKDHLYSKGIDFNDKDIAYSQFKKEFDRLNGLGTPLIMIDNTRLDGYDKEELDRALKQNGYIK